MATEYINRDEALKIICGPCSSFPLCELGVEIPCKYFTRINAIPKADVVEVVRCKDCVHLDPETDDCKNPFGIERPRPDNFCCNGRRRSNSGG